MASYYYDTSYSKYYNPYYSTYGLTRYNSCHNLRGNIDRQDYIVDKISDKVRTASASNKVTRDSLELKNQQLYRDLKDKIDAKNKAIKRLEEELNSWQRVVNEVYDKYSNLRTSHTKKEYSIERLNSEIKACKKALEEAIREKKIYAAKMEDLDRARKHVENDYSQLYEVTERLMTPWKNLSLEEPVTSTYVPKYYPTTYTSSTYTPTYYYDDMYIPSTYSKPYYYDDTYLSTYTKPSYYYDDLCTRKYSSYLSGTGDFFTYFK